MEPTKDRITPEQFYSESKWPEMKDKFDKSAFLFHYYDLCQFANDYAQQELQAYRERLKAAIGKRMEEVDPTFALAYYDIAQLIDTVTPT